MTRWKLTIEYQGGAYAGWQLQDDVPTIQGKIEQAITGFCQQQIRIYVAGRTDAGVHARGQVAHFDMDYGDRELSGHDLTKALNAHLRNETISILNAEPVDELFHARFSAQNKLYIYRIINRSSPPSLERGLAWHVRRPLNAAAMNEAAKILLGRHDFTSFRASDCQAKSPLKTLDRLDVTQEGDIISFEVEGRSFLHHQVRNMVGTLALVGEGKWSAGDVKTALEAKNRTEGGPTAPPEGLYLVRIEY